MENGKWTNGNGRSPGRLCSGRGFGGQKLRYGITGSLSLPPARTGCQAHGSSDLVMMLLPDGEMRRRWRWGMGDGDENENESENEDEVRTRMRWRWRCRCGRDAWLVGLTTLVGSVSVWHRRKVGHDGKEGIRWDDGMMGWAGWMSKAHSSSATLIMNPLPSSHPFMPGRALVFFCHAPS